jgi:hypothetical protein
VKIVEARHRFEVEPLAEPLEHEEGRMTFVHVEHGRVETERAERADAADAEHELLAEPVLAVAAVEPVGDRAGPRRVPSTSVSSR